MVILRKSDKEQSSIQQQSSDLEQSCEQAGAGYFLGSDLLDEVMGGLVAAYGKLASLENKKQFPDPVLVTKYADRMQDIELLKESFPIEALHRAKSVTNIYIQELKQARLLLYI